MLIFDGSLGACSVFVWKGRALSYTEKLATTGTAQLLPEGLFETEIFGTYLTGTFFFVVVVFRQTCVFTVLGTVLFQRNKTHVHSNRVDSGLEN